MKHKKKWNKKQKNKHLKNIHKCQECGISDGEIKLCVHHVIPKCCNGNDDKENLIKVCKRCHQKLDNWVLKRYSKL